MVDLKKDMTVDDVKKMIDELRRGDQHLDQVFVPHNLYLDFMQDIDTEPIIENNVVIGLDYDDIPIVRQKVQNFVKVLFLVGTEKRYRKAGKLNNAKLGPAIHP